MLKKIQKTILTSIIDSIDYVEEKEEIISFSFEQIRRMPDYLRWGISIVSLVFNYSIFLIKGKTFSRLTEDDKVSLVQEIKIRKTFLLFDLIRFYRSIILVKMLEISYAEE